MSGIVGTPENRFSRVTSHVDLGNLEETSNTSQDAAFFDYDFNVASVSL